MTKKNAKKNAARARQAAHGGRYQDHLRHVGGADGEGAHASGRPAAWPEYLERLWPIGQRIQTLLHAAGHEEIDFGWHVTGSLERSTREFQVRIDDGFRSFRAERRVRPDSGEAAFEAVDDILSQEVLAQVLLYAGPRTVSSMNMTRNPMPEQLRELLARCDDEGSHHVLWVEATGDVRLDPLPEDMTPVDFERTLGPRMKLRYETFVAGNGYVGPEAAADDAHVRALFADLQKGWRGDGDAWVGGSYRG